MILCLFIMLLYITSQIKVFNKRNLSLISEINITIKTKGLQNILNGDFKFLPNQTLINDKIQEKNQYQYNLNVSYSNITMRWNYQLTSCSYMFEGLSNIIKIDFSNFDSSKVTYMRDMFHLCTSLTSINFQNFDTSSVVYMGYVFDTCSSLTSIDLSHFNTSACTDMNAMFDDCHSLISIDLHNFDTSHVTDMNFMFYSNYKLIYANLNNFNTTLVGNMNSMFSYCKSLLYINLNTFKEKSTGVTLTDIFISISPNVTYCINNTLAPNIASKLSSYSLLNNCSNICFENNIKFIINKNICLTENISDFISNNNVFSDFPLSNSINLYESSLSDSNNSNSFLIDYFLYDSSSNNFALSDSSLLTSVLPTTNLSNSILSYTILNDSNLSDSLLSDTILYDSNLPDSIISDIILYHSNLPDSIISDTILTDSILTDSILSSIIFSDSNLSDSILSNNILFVSNLSDSILFDSILSDSDIFSSTLSYLNLSDSPQLDLDFPNIILTQVYSENKVSINCEKFYNYEQTGCIEYIPEGYYLNNTKLKTIDKCAPKDFYNGIYGLNNNNHNNNKISSNKEKDNIINIIQNDLLSGNIISLLNITNGKAKDLIIKKDNVLFTITTSDNQNNNDNKNESTIKLGDCEKKLRDHYKISDNGTLLIFKMEISEEGLLIPIIEYEVYNSETNEKLDLSYCKDSKISISIPVNINEDNLFKYNTSSEYYNDICFIYTSEKGTDLSLGDRRNEYSENNQSLCEVNCQYNGYNNDTKKALCECQIKINLPLISEIVINKDKLINDLFDIKKSLNIKVIKCYKLLFSTQGIVNNIGNYIILSIILIYIISIVIFIIKGYRKFIIKLYN